MSKLSFMGSVDHLKRMFGDIASDYVDIETVYHNTGLDKSVTSEREKLYNRLSAMRHYKLVTKEYDKQGGTKIITGLRLTPKGRLAVHGSDSEQASPLPIEDPVVVLTRWRADAELLQELYPGFEVVYDIRLRKERG